MTVCRIDVRPRGVLCSYISRVCRAGPPPITLLSSFSHHICLQHIRYSRIFSDLAPKINRCHSMIDLFSALPQLPNGSLYEKLLKCAVAKDSEAGIARCGRFSRFVDTVLIVWFGLYLMLRHLYTLSGCWVRSFFQGLMVFFLCRKQSIVTRACGGRPVETNGLAFDK